MNGQCMRCKAQREIQEPELQTMKNGKKAYLGRCGECGAKIWRIAKADAE